MTTLADDFYTGENDSVEFKEVLPKPTSKWMKTVVSFANGNGGKLVVGVRDSDHRVVGVPPECAQEIMDGMVDTIIKSCVPTIYPHAALQNVDGKLIVMVEIPSGGQCPYYIKRQGMMEGTYIRSGASTRLADEAALKELMLYGKRQSYDHQPCFGCAVDDLGQWCSDLTSIARELRGADVESLTINQLVSWGFLVPEGKTYKPTNAYAILRNVEPLRSCIRCAVFKGTDREEFIDRKEFDAPLPDLINEAYHFVLRNIRMASSISGIGRRDNYELDPSAIREAICNAVVHRSYLVDRDIQVALYDDRLEITSPGSLVKGLTVDKAMSGLSQLRNKALARMMSYLGFVESWGSGFPRMAKAFSAEHHSRLVVHNWDDAFRVTILRPHDPVNDPVNEPVNEPVNDPVKLSSKEREVLQRLAEMPEETLESLAAYCRCSVPTIKRRLNVLRNNSCLVRVGSDKTGHWHVTPMGKANM